MIMPKVRRLCQPFRFTGTRDAVTSFGRQSWKDINLIWMMPVVCITSIAQNPVNRWNGLKQSKTGRVVEAINRKIMGMAQKCVHPVLGYR
jgi:hypothetical protein